MRPLKSFQFHTSDPSTAYFHGDNIEMRVTVLEERLFRVTFLRGGKWRLPRTWAIAPGGKGEAVGRHRDDKSDFSLPAFQMRQEDPFCHIQTPGINLTIQTMNLALKWSHDGRVFLSDRDWGAWSLSERGEIAHAFKVTEQTRFFGLGERSGALNLRGRRFEMRNVDAMGYDAERTDPLYKHFPFLIGEENGIFFGLFYDNFATCRFDLGQEIDNYHGPFASYRAEDGDVDLYVMVGPSLAEVTERFTWLTGKPHLPPRWSLGYSGSTMSYTEAENADRELRGFLEKVKEHKIPCRSFHLSSGYTSRGANRYVFTWNTAKIPRPEDLVATFKANEVELIPNVKPVLLKDHPLYAEAESAGLFVKTEGDRPEESFFWGGEGSHLDFTNETTRDWWKTKIKKQLLEKGIAAVWNDNNEFEVWDESATVEGFGERLPMSLMRPVQTLLMARSSFEALKEYAPDKPPMVVSRSGMPGLQRFAQTWSGDNTTDWKTLRFNLAMALNLSLSGVSFTGHDVGGFAGPVPDEELFLRWLQHGIFYPRLVIHSWKADGHANEPWMYPRLMPLVHAAFALRERLEPYIWSCLNDYHEHYRPILRPLFYLFSDPQCRDVDDQFLVGDYLLSAPILSVGESKRKIYLPEHPSGWVDGQSQRHFAGGQWITIEVKEETIPHFWRGDYKSATDKMTTDSNRKGSS